MSSNPVPDVGPASARGRRFRVLGGVAIALVALVLLAAGLLITGILTQRVPQFESLAAHPDRSLQGTVAYFADKSRCVRVVAASGSPARTVFCLPEQDVSKAIKEGKEIGPQLMWLPGGRLQVTMFRMTPPPKPGAVPAYHPGWQKIIDVRTPKIVDVPAADLPSQPNLTAHPMVSPSGQRISWTSDRGRVTVKLTDRSGSRTLLSVRGPSDYTYGLQSAFWAPDWQWIAADDGRILIITTGHPSVTRVLTDESSQVAFGGEYSRFAVTSANILTPAR